MIEKLESYARFFKIHDEEEKVLGVLCGNVGA